MSKLDFDAHSKFRFRLQTNPETKTLCDFRLDWGPIWDKLWDVEKKTAKVLERLKSVRGLSEDEKILFARSLAATPDERWRMHENFLRSHGLFTRSARKAFGFK